MKSVAVFIACMVVASPVVIGEEADSGQPAGSKTNAYFECVLQRLPSSPPGSERPMVGDEGELWDLNGDAVVDAGDWRLFWHSLGCSAAEAGFWPHWDTNGNNLIDWNDLGEGRLQFKDAPGPAVAWRELLQQDARKTSPRDIFPKFVLNAFQISHVVALQATVAACVAALELSGAEALLKLLEGDAAADQLARQLAIIHLNFATCQLDPAASVSVRGGESYPAIVAMRRAIELRRDGKLTEARELIDCLQGALSANRQP